MRRLRFLAGSLNRRHLSGGIHCFVLICALSCVSKSVPTERFTASLSMVPPLLKPAVADPGHFSFAVVGDTHIEWQNTERLRTILTMASNQGAAFVVLLGDIVDYGEEADYLAVLKAVRDTGWYGRVAYVLGNHDIIQDGWNHFRTYLGPSHFSFSAGNSRVVALDTADGTVDRDEQTWFAGELAAAASTNLFVLSHYLPFVPGQRTYLKIASDEEAQGLMKVASDRGVHTWFGAHYHSYAVGTVEGVDYVVAGGGGKRRMPPVMDYFFVRVDVAGKDVKYNLVTVP